MVSGVLAARILGPEGRGELAAVYYYPSIIALLGILGLSQAAAYEVSRRPGDEARIMRAGFWLGLLLAIPQVFVAVLLVPWMLPADKAHLAPTIRWFMVYVAITYPGLALLGVDRGAFRFMRYNVLRVLPHALYVVGILSVWAAGRASIVAFTACNLAAASAALLVRAAVRARPLSEALPAGGEMRRLLAAGLHLHLPQIALILTQRADIAMVIYLVPAEQVGLYVAALAVGMGQFGVASAFVQVGFVKVAGERDRAMARRHLFTQFRAAQVAALVLGAVFLLIAPHVIRYAFGERFVPATRTAYWLVGAMAFIGLGRILDVGLRALGRAWAGALAYLAGLAVIVTGGLLLIPRLGIEGMGMAMLAGGCVVTLLEVVFLATLEKAGLAELWGLRPATVAVVASSIRKWMGS